MRNSRNVWNTDSPHYRRLIAMSNLSADEKAHATAALDEVLREVAMGQIAEFRMKLRGIHSDGFGEAQAVQLGGRQAAIERAGFSIIRMHGVSPAKDVWTIASDSFKGAHFAVMPLALADRCVKAGTSEHGCCAQCGAPWHRVTEHTDEIDASHKGSFFNAGKTAEYQDTRSQKGPRYRHQMVGCQRSCRCNADVIPCTVLDMFGGVGTTAHAALKHGRDAILVELNADYIRLAEQRLAEYLHPAIKLAAD